MTATAPQRTTHLVIRASAGAGKTYALSNRYLQLLHEGATPDTILATTFTRKAAGEILSRVLTRLARAALDAPAAAEMARALQIPTLNLAQCRALLALLCQSLHRISISTIDSFFNRMVQSFRHELGIPPGARIVTPEDPVIAQLRREAIDALLADDEPRVLIDLLRRLHHDTAQRSITDAIDQIVSRLYDVYRQAPPEAWAQLDPPQALTPRQLADTLNELAQMIGSNTSKALARGMKPNFEDAAARHWERFLSKGLTPKIGDDPPVYSKAAIPPPIVALYETLISHAEAELVGQLARQNQATFELLERFDGHYRQLRHSRRVLLFSDLPHKLARELPARGEELLTEMYYRLDARVGHLLLDEFQDTSIEQWEVFKPFAQEIASFGDGSRTFFCVGDAKQAIYGWRGGCAEIFDKLEEDLGLALSHRRSLSKSRRSSPAILEAANLVFGSLTTNPALADKLPEVIADWAGRFETHSAYHDKQPGYVELITSPAAAEDPQEPEEAPEDEGSAPSPHERYVARKIAELSRAAPGHDIGVLVSTNDMVRRMIYLLQELGVEASGEGGNPVSDDPAVGAVLSALVLADHPGDSAAAFHVLHSPLAEIVGLDSLEPQAIGGVGLAIRAALLGRGYAALITDWSRKLASSCGERSLRRLMQLIELADRFEPTMTLRTRDFVAFVEATTVEQPAPAMVRIMTVYKAKGLEFDAVVLPQLDRTLLSTADLPVYVKRESPTGPIEAIYRATNETVRRLCPPVAEAHEQERARRLRDDLCALYVAMTRPKYALHMIVKPLTPRQDGSPGVRGWSNLSFASILRRSLSDGEPTFDGEETLYAGGDPMWFKGLPKVAAPAVKGPAAAPLRPKLQPAPPRSRRLRRVVTPSSLEAAGRVRAADLLALEPTAQRLRGTVLHAWFEQVGFLDRQALPDEKALLAAAQKAAPAAEEKWLRQQLADFHAMLARPAVAAALAAPGGENVELWRERSFLTLVEDELLQGQFDRVVLQRDGSEVRQAELIDFKTDAVTAQTLAARVETYRPQIEAYRQALGAILGIKPGAVRARLLFVALGESVEL